MLSRKTASTIFSDVVCTSAALNGVLCGLNYLAIVDLDCHRCDVASILVSLNDGAQVSNEEGVLVAYEKILILDQSSQLQKKKIMIAQHAACRSRLATRESSKTSNDTLL